MSAAPLGRDPGGLASSRPDIRHRDSHRATDRLSSLGAKVVVAAHPPDFIVTEDAMIIAIILSVAGLGFLCWLAFNLLCAQPHKRLNVAFPKMWRRADPARPPARPGDCCATYLERLQGQRDHRLRKKAMTSGCLDHPPFIPRVAPRASVASARSFVARSIST